MLPLGEQEALVEMVRLRRSGSEPHLPPTLPARPLHKGPGGGTAQLGGWAGAVRPLSGTPAQSYTPSSTQHGAGHQRALQPQVILRKTTFCLLIRGA